MSSTGETIAYFRKMRHISQEQLAKIIGINRPQLSNIETGLFEPSFELVRKIALALNVTADEIDKRLRIEV